MLSTRFKSLRTNRFRLFIGPGCNAKCKFCYYIDFLQKNANPSTKLLKRETKWAFSTGARAIDFSGGEPTVREDLPELISFARNSGYEKISIITNGIRLSDASYFRRLIDSGLNEILVSIHGANAEVHERLVGVPKSFFRLRKALDNIKSSGVRLRTNTTVLTENYQQLPELAKLIAEYRPHAVNFILFNNWYSPQFQVSLMPNFEDACKFIAKAIDIISADVPKISVRYVPFCFMKGYEKYVANFPQLPYDPDEWAPEIQLFSPDFGVFAPNDHIPAGLRIRRLGARLALLAGTKTIDSRWLSIVQRNYFKPRECGNCAYEKMCDGLKRGYEKLYPDYIIYPKSGGLVRDPMEFRGPYLIRTG